MKANIVHLKRFTKDANGLENVIYATDSQVAVLVGMRNDPEKRNNFVKIGSIIFSPADVAFIETKTRETYELPKYFLERHDKESSSLIQIK